MTEKLAPIAQDAMDGGLSTLVMMARGAVFFLAFTLIATGILLLDADECLTNENQSEEVAYAAAGARSTR